MIMYKGYSGTEKTILIEEDTDLDEVARTCIDALEKYKKKALTAFEQTVEDMRDDPQSDYDIYDFGEMQPYTTVKFPFSFLGFTFVLGVRETYESDTDSLYSVYVDQIPARIGTSAGSYSLSSKSKAQDAFLALLINITESDEAKEKEKEGFGDIPF